ncbi:uncharacterized protein [Dermacentor andersoni]|uniref:uncharacterized protein isoform X2 n=1 Tax=Dermacentor andersoni TaxID=34620 RepID=UPI003B3A1A87
MNTPSKWPWQSLFYRSAISRLRPVKSPPITVLAQGQSSRQRWSAVRRHWCTGDGQGDGCLRHLEGAGSADRHRDHLLKRTRSVEVPGCSLLVPRAGVGPGARTLPLLVRAWPRLQSSCKTHTVFTCQKLQPSCGDRETTGIPSSRFFLYATKEDAVSS